MTQAERIRTYRLTFEGTTTRFAPSSAGLSHIDVADGTSCACTHPRRSVHLKERLNTPFVSEAHCTLRPEYRQKVNAGVAPIPRPFSVRPDVLGFFHPEAQIRALAYPLWPIDLVGHPADPIHLLARQIVRPAARTPPATAAQRLREQRSPARVRCKVGGKFLTSNRCRCRTCIPATIRSSPANDLSSEFEGDRTASRPNESIRPDQRRQSS